MMSVFPTGKPSGYDRVRNAEIGNKVGSPLTLIMAATCPPLSRSLS